METHFAGVPVVSTESVYDSRAAVIHAGELEIELNSGADATTVRANHDIATKTVGNIGLCGYYVI